MKNYKINRNKVISFIFYVLLAILLSLVVKSLANTVFTGLTLSYFKKFGLFIFTLVSLIFIRELFLYRKTVRQVINKYLQFVYYLMLLSMTFYLGSQNKIEWKIVILFALTITVVWILCSIEKIIENNNKQDEKSDLPIKSFNDLFPTRKKEFKRIYDFINNLDVYDPYALAISAAWGEGKTSFVNAIIEKLKAGDNEVIFVQPMILDTREKLLNYVFGQIEVILNQHEIYTGKGSPYQNYFNLLLKLVGNKNINNLANLFDIFPEDKQGDLRDFKEGLEGNLQNLIDQKKRIVIIIDDLDRVEQDTIYNTLTFIKEIVDLKGVIVLFIVDYEKIVSDRITIDYLEKFINTKFELSKIANEEIFNHYFKTLLPSYNNSYLIHEIKELEINFNHYINEITTSIEQWLESEKKKLEELQESKKEIDVQNKINRSTRIDKFNTEFIELKNKLSNPRFIKKIISGIRESFNFIENDLSLNNLNVFVENEEIKTNHLIFKLNIFKVLFKEMYEMIFDLGTIGDFVKKNNDNIIVKSFFRETKKEILLFENEQILRDMKYEFYNSLIYSDSISHEIFLKIKTEHEKILEKIDSKNEINIDQWDFISLTKLLTAINYAQGTKNVVGLNKWLKSFTDITVSLAKQNKITIGQVFELLGDSSRNALVKYPEYLEEISLFLSTSNIELLNKKEKNTSNYYLESIDLTLILDVKAQIQMICWLYKFGDTNFTLGSLKGAFDSVTSIKILNELLLEELLEVKVNDHPKDSIECFEDIFNSMKEKILNIHNKNKEILEAFKYYEEKIINFIQIYKLKNKIVVQLSAVPINSTNRFEIQDGTPTKVELLERIEQLYNYLGEEQNSIEYNHFRYFHSILNDIGWLNERILSKVDLKKLEHIFNALKLKNNGTEKFYDESSWYYCQIKLNEIKFKFVS
jgi:hypothetical protein